MKSRRARCTLFLLFLLATGWVSWWKAGWPVARLAGGKFGGALIEKGQGKITDPALFIYHRGLEGFLMATTGVALTLVAAVLYAGFKHWQGGRHARGIVLGLLIFLGLNCWTEVATNTALFWLPFFSKEHVDNIAQYQIKKQLLAEHVGVRRAVLLGNSQTRATMKVETLNELLAPGLWTTELHHNGCHAFETYLIVDDLRSQPYEVAIVYISEIFIFSPGAGGVAPRFLRLRDLPLLNQLHGWPQLGPKVVEEGMAASVCPLYRLNSSLSQRMLGGPLAELPQLRYDAARSVGRTPPLRTGADLSPAATAEFQERSFELAITALANQGRTVVLIGGSVHPKLQEMEPPGEVAELHRWLETLPLRWPGIVTVIPETAFFQPKVEDFADYVHLTELAQDRFTRGLAAYLLEKGLVAKPAPRE